MKIFRWLFATLLLALVFAGIFGGRHYLDLQAAQAQAQQAWPATVIETAVVEAASWPQLARAVGSLRAVEGTAVSSQVAGSITAIGFESGARVNKGDFLLQLDNSTQLAALRADQATLAQASSDLQRRHELFSNRSVSLEDVQHAQLRHDVARAAVENDQAALAKLRISAPFSGVLGIRQVSVGQYLSEGQEIVGLQRWDPLLLDFDLPQQYLPRLALGQTVRFRVDAFPEQEFSATVSAFEAAIDADTRSLPIQATLANGDHVLRPGLFGSIEIELGGQLEGLLVPSSAIAHSTFGDSVFVVREGLARAVRISVLAEREQHSLVQGSDLAAGERVVSIGQHKLRDGMAVNDQTATGQH
ncbi:MAG: efflux RND transporter periplasmic adaptor subunit [Thauera sp.]|jgi:membrane fusion protein (multidrug efflux system)|nr:efflux RND transporter periplasmic adaptor subunit [Thauera sp.]